jgi:ABC-type Fe3+/spermidine/putrescine transport system ATPase subunit
VAEVALVGVHKRFPASGVSPENHVVRGVDLTIGDGEVVCLLGGSGCGKTTTLRMIAGLDTVSDGRISIGGVEVSGPAVFVPPERRRLGMVFQSYAIWPHLDVFENVAFPLRMLGTNYIATRVDAALAAVRLTALARRKPSALSGGQQQRVAIARALVAEPRVLLLDEPLSNLDANLRHELRDEIRQLVRRAGLTAVLVTHDQEEASAVADRIALMDQGRITQVGPPRELFEAPRTSAVALFLGVSNRLTGQRDGAGVRVGDVHVPAMILEDSPASGPCRLGFRPGAARLVASGPGLPGVVEEALWTGTGARVTVRIGGDRVVVDGAGGVAVGASVSLQVDAAFVLPCAS